MFKPLRRPWPPVRLKQVSQADTKDSPGAFADQDASEACAFGAAHRRLRRHRWRHPAQWRGAYSVCRLLSLYSTLGYIMRAQALLLGEGEAI